MTQAPSAIPVRLVSIVEAITGRDSEHWPLFYQKFARGLRFLVQRQCRNHADECFNAVVTASMEAVLNNGVLRDEDLPALIRSNFRRILLNYAEGMAIETEASVEVLSLNASEANDLRQRLAIFTPFQREALFRFYVQNEDASSICHDLDLEPERFEFIRKVVRHAMRLSMEMSDARMTSPSQPAFTTSNAISAVAG